MGLVPGSLNAGKFPADQAPPSGTVIGGRKTPNGFDTYIIRTVYFGTQ